MTDHKTEALDAISAAEMGGYDEVDTHLAVAQVHATLYLAEQQRIANLIALGKTHTPGEYWRDGDCSVTTPGVLRPDIREGLGL